VELPGELARLVVLAGGDAGPSRSRQLRWVAGELVRAAEELQWRATGPADWFDERFLSRYLDAAERGAYRQRSPARSTASAAASARVRRSCLAALAAAAGVQPAGVPPTGRTTAPRPGAAPRAVARALQWWRAEASAADALGATVRSAAVAHLVHELGLRTGEVVAMELDDVDLPGRRVRFTPAPQAARSARPAVWTSVSPGTADLLRRWLQHRTAAVALTPHINALWVSLAGNHTDGRVVPAGLPLRARGLTRAHAAAVERLNLALAGAPDWRPLPAALADLRRSAPVHTPGVRP
jgi:integrase